MCTLDSVQALFDEWQQHLVSFEVVSLNWAISSTAEPGLTLDSGRLGLSDTDLDTEHQQKGEHDVTY